MAIGLWMRTFYKLMRTTYKRGTLLRYFIIFHNKGRKSEKLRYGGINPPLENMSIPLKLFIFTFHTS